LSLALIAFILMKNKDANAEKIAIVAENASVSVKVANVKTGNNIRFC
jgi:hypothetical protein